jgi:hypothetical protein
MTRFVVILVGCCALGAGCDRSSRTFTTPGSPTAPSAPAPAPTPQPGPFGPFAPFEVTEITIGQTVTGVITTPPECIDYKGWPCLYFQLAAPANGKLTVELTYKPESQPPGQGVDISVRDESGREAWADFGTPTVTRVSMTVTAGGQYRIILWYAFSRLEYELQTSLE